MEINYEEIEQATSKEFVKLIQNQLSKNTVWKHLDLEEDEKYYSIQSIECYFTNSDTTYAAYYFQFDKSNSTFLYHRMSTLWIKQMIKKGWFDKAISP